MLEPNEMDKLLEPTEMNKLLELIKDISGKDLSKLLKDMDKPKRTFTNINNLNSPVKTYTTVTKKCTCMICNSTFNQVYKLHKNDKISCTDTQGQSHTVIGTGKDGELTISSCVSRCINCREIVKTWSREELEQKFCKLLFSCTFKEVANYATINED